MPNGLHVLVRDSQIVHEFDYLIRFEDKPYLIEVVSAKYHGVQSAVEQGKHYGGLLYGTTPTALLFSPHESRELDGDLHVDIGYTRKELAAKEERLLRTSLSGRNK